MNRLYLGFNPRWLLWLAFLSCCVSFSPAFAETKTVVVQGKSDVCFARERALDLARTGASNEAYSECWALGKGWSFSGVQFPGYSQCFRCGKSEEFRCAVTQAVYNCVNMDKENAEKAAKKRAEKEATDKAAKERADQLAEEKASKALMEKVAAETKAKAAKDKADKEAKENAERSARLKAAKELAEKQTADKVIKEKESKEDAARLATLKKVEEKKSVSGNSIDDAFSKMERQTGKVPTPMTTTGDIDAQFKKMEAYRAEQERLRVTTLRARQEREERHSEHVLFCEKAVSDQESCFVNACGPMPEETVSICASFRHINPSAQQFMNASWQPTSGAFQIAGGSIIFPNSYQPSCTRKEVPNEQYTKWAACTSSHETQCMRNGTVARNVGSCVRQRERTGSTR